MKISVTINSIPLYSKTFIIYFVINLINLQFHDNIVTVYGFHY